VHRVSWVPCGAVIHIDSNTPASTRWGQTTLSITYTIITIVPHCIDCITILMTDFKLLDFGAFYKIPWICEWLSSYHSNDWLLLHSTKYPLCEYMTFIYQLLPTKRSNAVVDSALIETKCPMTNCLISSHIT